MTTHAKRTRAAVTLIEITLGLALAAIVIFIGIRTYWTSQDNHRAQALEQELGTVKSIVDARFGPIGNYSLVTSDLVASALPKSEGTPTSAGWTTTSINNPFKGGVYVSGDATTYTIEADLISTASCVRIMKFFNDQKDLANITLWDTASGSQIDYIDVVAEGPPAASRLSADCTNGSLQTADIQFVFGNVNGGSGGGGSGGSGGGGGSGSGGGSGGNQQPGQGNGQIATCTYDTPDQENCAGGANGGVYLDSMNQKQYYAYQNLDAFTGLFDAGYLPGISLPTASFNNSTYDWDYKGSDGSSISFAQYVTSFVNTVSAYCSSNDCQQISKNAQQAQANGSLSNNYWVQLQ